MQTTTLFNPKPEKKPRGVPGGEWGQADDKQPPVPSSVSKPAPQSKPPSNLKPDAPTESAAPVAEKQSGFNFIKKGPKQKTPPNPLDLPSLEQIKQAD